jgi:hypothetical protein
MTDLPDGPAVQAWVTLRHMAKYGWKLGQPEDLAPVVNAADAALAEVQRERDEAMAAQQFLSKKADELTERAEQAEARAKTLDERLEFLEVLLTSWRESEDFDDDALCEGHDLYLARYEART